MQGGNPDIDNVDDLLEFRKTHESFRLLGFSEADTNNIYRLKFVFVISCRTVVRSSFVEEDSMLFWIRAMDTLREKDTVSLGWVVALGLQYFKNV